MQLSWGNTVDSEYSLAATYNADTHFYSVEFIVMADLAKRIKDEVFEARRPHVNRSGFRPGHVPRNIVEQQYGGPTEFYAQAFGGLAVNKIREFCPYKALYVRDHDIKEIDGGSWSIKCSIYTEHEVDDFDGLLAGMDYIMPKFDPQEQTNKRIELFRKMNPYLHIKDGVAEDGDMVEVTINAFIDGKEFAPGTVDKTNIPVIQDGTQPRGLYEKIVGSKAGDSFVIVADNVKEIASRFTDSADGHKYVMEVHVNHVYRCELPKLDDDLAVTAGYTTYVEWHTALLQAITRMCEAKEKEYKETTIIDYLLVKSKHPRFPDSWVVEKIESINAVNKRQALTTDDFDKIHDLFRSITIISLLGKHLKFERKSDEDDQKYAQRVLEHVIETKAKFIHVDPNTNAVGGRDSESSSTTEQPHASVGA